MPASDPPTPLERIEVLERELVAARSELRATREALEKERRHRDVRFERVAVGETLGVLAAGVAHDLNNLLLNIIGNAELVLRAVDPEGPLRSRVSAIEYAASRAAELARQLRTVASGEVVALTECSLAELVGDTVSLVMTSLPESVRVRFEVTSAMPAICGNATRLRQVVMNLLANAAEAIGDRTGEIVVRVGVVHADAPLIASLQGGAELGPGDYLSLEISDDGCGMTPEVMAHVFDPLFSTKRDDRGLGLAAVLGIVRQHSGGIRVSSEPGRGTRFQLLLPPAERVGRALSGLRAPSGSRSSRGAILVVEDEDPVCATVRLALEYAGFSVLAARDGRSALDLFERCHDDVVAVLLDLTLPTGSGAAILRRIRELAPTVPVFLTGNHGEQEGSGAFVGFTVDGYFEKPYALEALTSRIVEAIEDQRRAG
ncbi:MAG: response regulator [Polyangiaceae bacterium]|nr:response regulator [Polyangiaceae bacterium]